MALQAKLLERLLKEDGIAVVPFPSNPSFPAMLRWAERIPALRTCVRFFVFLFRLWRQEQRVDTVHIFAASWLYFFVVVAPAILVSRARGKRIVLTYHGGAAPDFFRRWGAVVRPLVRLADVVTAPSTFLASLIRTQLDCAASIVPNVLDTAGFSYRRRTTFRPRLLVNRHLEKIYDVESVLKAFGEVQQRYPEATLWVAGSGSQKAYLHEIAERLQNVTFLGAVPHEEMPVVYDQCDILVNASRVDNFPGALLEASAAGLVVVSTAAGGIPAVYRDGETALLVTPGDWQALAAAVERVLDSPARAAQLAEAGLRLVRACEWRAVRPLLYATYGLDAEAARAVPVRSL
jgi:glycosyltransferase involved in cell wall biosynthesis